MKLTGEYLIPASKEAVWQALNDPAVLKACIPGCESFDTTGENEFTAQVTAKVGPVKAKFKGKVTLSDLVPPESYRITGEGQGGAAGFAKGGAVVRLAEAGDGTILTYEVEATVGGKLAQIGQRLIDSAAKKMANDFFGTFSEHLGGGAEDKAPAVPAKDATDHDKGAKAAMIVLALVFVLALLSQL